MSSERLFIGRLSERARKEDVEAFFQGYGKIVNVVLKRGFGFVEFEDKQNAENAMVQMNGKNLCGQCVIIGFPKRDRGRLRLDDENTLLIMLKTRSYQLSQCIQMESWAKAYQTAADVHHTMGLLESLEAKEKRRLISSPFYVDYFHQLAQIGWICGDIMFHTAALLRKFIAEAEDRNIYSTSEIVEQSTRILLAFVASMADHVDIRSYLRDRLKGEDEYSKIYKKLTSFLRFSVPLTHKWMRKEIFRLRIYENACQPAKNLVDLLENCDHLTMITAAVQKELNDLAIVNKPEHDQYIDAILRAFTVKIVTQIASMNSSISLKDLREIVPFHGTKDLELLLTNLGKIYTKIRIDHLGNRVLFQPIDDSLEFYLEGEFNYDHDTDTNDVRFHVSKLYEHLRKICPETIDEEPESTRKLKDNVELFKRNRADNYRNTISRMKYIEKIKQDADQVANVKIQQVIARKEQEKKQKMLQAKEIVLREVEQKQQVEKQRKHILMEQIEIQAREVALKAFLSHPICQKFIKKFGETAVKKMTIEYLITEKARLIDEECREQEAKLNVQEKHFDYFVRKCYLEKAMLWQKMLDERKEEEKHKFWKYEDLRIANEVQKHQEAVAIYKRLTEAKDDAKDFIDKIKASSMGTRERG
ncbi:RNA recognition motif domain-containing protein [Ditylenchus destructor]|uniref:RNA recognition motif domain-containing protein n=1 Tax=Ditylenchus destructor TaxID=166010 RepID=A0AAD4N6I3_9BILA|nr:RNA recognition motif domain-containing protein [Ditylenchus destructor]